MKPYNITITVTPKGKKFKISSAFPMDVPVVEIIDMLESTRDSLVQAGAKYFDKHHQLSETEKQVIAKTLTLRQIADDQNGD